MTSKINAQVILVLATDAQILSFEITYFFLQKLIIVI